MADDNANGEATTSETMQVVVRSQSNDEAVQVSVPNPSCYLAEHRSALKEATQDFLQKNPNGREQVAISMGNLSNQVENVSLETCFSTFMSVFQKSAGAVVASVQAGSLQMPEAKNDGSLESAMQNMINGMSSTMLSFVMDRLPDDGVEEESKTQAIVTTVIDCEEVD